VTNKYTTFHRATAARGVVFSAMAGWIVARGGQKVYVVDDATQFGKYLATTVKTRLGAAVVGSEEVLGEGKQTDFAATVGRVTVSGATVVTYGGTMTNGGRLVHQLRAAGYTGLFLIHDLADQAPFADLAGAGAGVRVFCGCTYSLADGLGDFDAAYKGRFGSDPALFANVAYDMTNMLLQGIGAGAVTRKALNTWLGSHTFQGLVSSYKFSADGDLDPSVTRVNVFTVGEPGEQSVPLAQG
jgi:branched-chain amino acid transport system substrate-binding protein